MKLGITVLALVTALPATALAAEGPSDVQTDHVDAFDDGGPRTFGLLVNPGAVLFGVLGAEADLLLGDVAAVSLEADWMSQAGATGYGVTFGTPLFPQRV